MSAVQLGGTAQELSTDFLEHLSRASDEVLLCCTKMQAMSPHVFETRGASVLRDVSFTVVSIERALCTFFENVLERAGVSFPPDQDPSLSLVVERLKRLPAQHSLHKRVPAGGFASLLYHISWALDATQSAVAAVEEANKWPRLRWLGILAPYISALVSGTCTLYTPLAMVLPTRRMRRLLAYAVAFATILFVQFMQRTFSAQRRLQRCHKTLLLLLRTWLMCVELLHRANAVSSRSYACLIRDPHQRDYEDDLKPVSHRLLQYTSIPRDAAMWLNAGWRMQLVTRCIDIMYCSMHAGYQFERSRPHLGLLKWPVVAASGMYYGLRSNVAGELSAAIVSNADVHFIQATWGILDNYCPNFVWRTFCPSLGTNAPISINNVPCHVFGRRPLPDKFFQGSSKEAPPTEYKRAVLYLHGGGFVSGAFAVDAVMLSDWAKNSDMLIVYVHYAYAPQHRFPTAINQCLSVYRALRSRFPKVVVMGESAGGNLAAATTLLAMQKNVRKPDGLVLAYPALNLNSSPSPSRFIHLSDPLVPTAGFLPRLAAAYVPKELVDTPLTDPLMCPVFASDDQFKSMPPTYIAIGGCDPLLDDSIEFNIRLRRASVPGALVVFRTLPHGFLLLRHLSADASAAVKRLEEWAKAVLWAEAPDGQDLPTAHPGAASPPGTPPFINMVNGAPSTPTPGDSTELR